MTFSLYVYNRLGSPSQRPTCASSWWRVNSQVRDSLVRLCHPWWRLRPKDHAGRYERWIGSPGTPNGWSTQEAAVGRTPEGELGLDGPTGFLTLPGQEWPPPGIGPRNLNMIDTNRIADNDVNGASLQRQRESRPAGMGAKPFRSSTREILATKTKAKPNGTRNEHKRSGGQQQGHKDLEKSCWGLIVGERLTEEKLGLDFLLFFKSSNYRGLTVLKKNLISQNNN